MEQLRAGGTVLIPRDAHSRLTLAQLLRPVPELYRTTLHQDELAAAFLLLDVPSKQRPPKADSFLQSIRLKASFLIKNVRVGCKR